MTGDWIDDSCAAAVLVSKEYDDRRMDELGGEVSLLLSGSSLDIWQSRQSAQVISCVEEGSTG